MEEKDDDDEDVVRFLFSVRCSVLLSLLFFLFFPIAI